MKIYKLKIKAAPLPKMEDMEEMEDMASEEEGGEEGGEYEIGNMLREAAELCDEGDHEESMALVEEALSMMQEKYG